MRRKQNPEGGKRFYTKEVPVDSIIIVDGTRPITKVDNASNCIFSDIYLKEETRPVKFLP